MLGDGRWSEVLVAFVPAESRLVVKTPGKQSHGGIGTGKRPLDLHGALGPELAVMVYEKPLAHRIRNALEA